MTGYAPDENFDETSVPALWEAARYFLRWLIAICGSPRAVLAMNRLTPGERRDILFWLRPVEALVRRLLVAEAAEIAKSLPPGKPSRCRPPRHRTRRIVVQDPENSGQWAVRFVLSGRAGALRAVRRPARRASWARRPVPGACDDEFEYMRRLLKRLEAKPGPGPDGSMAPLPAGRRTEPASPRSAPRQLFSPWPTAERIEAVLRVLLDREPCVKRLARRLARRRSADIERFRRACRPPPPRPPGERPRYGDTPLRHASEHALRQLSVISNQRKRLESPLTRSSCGSCGRVSPRHLSDS